MDNKDLPSEEHHKAFLSLKINDRPLCAQDLKPEPAEKERKKVSVMVKFKKLLEWPGSSAWYQKWKLSS